MFFLRLKHKGYENGQIADILDCHRNTVGNYLRLYEESGMEGLRTLNFCGPRSKMDKHKPKVEASFRKRPPRTVKEARQRIKDLTGVKRSLGRVRTFLHRIGMKVRSTVQGPAKADPVKQQEFHDNMLQPLVQEAKEAKCHVLFMDGAHFVLAAFIGMVWCFERVYVKIAPGRFRLNVLGVINSTTHKLTALFNTDYINSTTVVELLKRIAVEYVGLPIFIILDNARYQHCELVKLTAQSLGINLVFLLPYSPNLNLIERLWKLVKAEVCNANYFPDPKSFQAAIVDFLNSLHKKPMKKELKSRLTHNFQLFRHTQNLAA